MENNTLKTIGQRRSVRSFKPDQLQENTLEAIAEAGRCAPYADEPARITIVQNAGLIDAINVAAKQAALHMGMPHLAQLGADPDFVGSYGAPTLIIISSPESSVAPEINCAAAAENMLIAAQALGLGACWVHFPLFFMYAEHSAEICGRLLLPQGHKPCACIALGYGCVDTDAGLRMYGEVEYIK